MIPFFFVFHDISLAVESLCMVFSRRLSRAGGLFTLALVVLDGSVAVHAAASEPDLRRERIFLQGLRDHGYFDLASEYIERLRAASDTPTAMRVVLDIEQGRGQLEEAVTLANLNRRATLLEQARAGLETVAQSRSNTPETTEVLALLARVLLEQGRTAVFQAGESETIDLKTKSLAEARTHFAEARGTYDRILGILRQSFKTGPQAASGSGNSARDALMDAELQHALTAYQEAQTYEPNSRQRKALLDTARAEFQHIHETYRTQLAGLSAWMWEAKCHEERGELDPAMGIYDELMKQPDPALTPLKRKVAYFRILSHAQRGEHASAVDRAEEWLRANSGEARTDDGLGVRYQLARNLIDQLPEMKADEKASATRRASRQLAEVIKDPSPFRSDATALLKKYGQQGAEPVASISNLSFDDAFHQAQIAASAHEWERALLFLRQAVRRGETTQDLEKINHARYTLAYCYFAQGNYYAAAVAAEHLARHYPKWSLAPKSPDISAAKAAEIALAAWTYAYNNYTEFDRLSDLEHLVSLAQYIGETWPDTDTSDTAYITLGEIEFGRGEFVEAARAFESIRESSPRHADVLAKAGESHWKQSIILRERGKENEAEAIQEARTAVALLEEALAAHRAAEVPSTNVGFLGNVNALAEVYRLQGEHEKVLTLVGPAIEALGKGPFEPDVARLRGLLFIQHLRASIANGQSDEAVTDMEALETADSNEGLALTQLYSELGRSLKHEIETLESKTDTASKTHLERASQAYARYLEMLVRSPSGHSFESFLFAGDALLRLGRTKEAIKTFEAILNDNTIIDPSSEDSQTRLLRVRLRRVEALRKDEQFDAAQQALDVIKQDNPRLLEMIMEQGFLYEDQAVSEASRGDTSLTRRHWLAAYNHWKILAAQLETGRPRRLEYYDSQYRAAVALIGLKQKAQAAQILRGVMTLSPTVGSPTMKAKYEMLLDQLSKAK